jgi:hypothetical protein
MFQHSLEHGARDHLHACGLSISADVVEGNSVRTVKPTTICDQEWDPHRNSDTAELVREPRFLDWKPSPGRRIRLFLIGASYAVAHIRSLGEVGTPKRPS